MNEAVIVIARQPKKRRGEIAAKNPHAGLQELVEAGKFEVQLHSAP